MLQYVASANEIHFAIAWNRGNTISTARPFTYISLTLLAPFDCFTNHRHVLRFVAAPAKVSIVHLTFDPLGICHPAENGSQNVWDK